MISIEKLKSLRPLPSDERDFRFSKLGGVAKLSNVPDRYIVPRQRWVMDQGDTDMCTAYAMCAVSADQEGVPLDPEAFWRFLKWREGRPDAYGADLRMVAKVACRQQSRKLGVGFVPAKGDVLTTRMTMERRNAAARGSVSEAELREADLYAKDAFFMVDGPYDFFDNIVSTLHQNSEYLESVLTGLMWRPSWDRAEGGMVPVSYDFWEKGYPHAIAIKGYDRSQDRLIAQLSNGIQIGDAGMFYLPRTVVNNEFRYGSITFRDVSREVAEHSQRVVRRSPFQALIDWYFSKIA